MNQLFNVLISSGLALMLQTTLLLAPGLLVLSILAKKRSVFSTLFGRSLLTGVSLGIILSLALSLGGAKGLPSLWKVPVPDHSPTSPTKMPQSAVNTSRKVSNDPVSLPLSSGQKLAPILPETSLKAPVESSAVVQVPEAAPLNLEGVFRFIAMVWLLGFVGQLGWLVACHFALWKVRRSARPVQDMAVQKILAEVCALLKVKSPRIVRHDSAKSPYLMGYLRPTVVIPADAPAMREELLRAVLTHEVMHFKRGDLWWNGLARLSCALLWPQPLLWMLCQRLEQINEEACDEAVLKGGCERQIYARCLLDWAERGTPHRVERVAGVGVLTGRSSLGQRIKTIMDGSGPRGGRVSGRARVALFLGTIALIVGMPLLVSSAPKPASIQAQSFLSPVGNSSGKRTLQTFYGTNHFSVSISGLKNGEFQGVTLTLRKKPELARVISGRTLRRTRTGGKTLWKMSDGSIYSFDWDGAGLISKSDFGQMTLNFDGNVQLVEFLEKQLEVEPAPLTEKQIQQWQKYTKLPVAQLSAVQKWARGQRPARLTGRVLNEDGQPVAGALINVNFDAMKRVGVEQSRTKLPDNVDLSTLLQYKYLLPISTQKMFRQMVKTEADGSYVVDGLVASNYSVGIGGYFNISQSGFEFKLPEEIALKNELVEARSDVTVAVPTITLTRGGLVQVQVVDQSTGARLPRIKVISYAKGSARSFPSFLVETNAQGESIFRLPVGEARVAVGGQSDSKSHAFVAMSKGTAYSIQKGATVSLDGGAAIPFTGVTDLKVSKGATRKVLLKLQPYITPTPTPTPVRLPPPPGKGEMTGRVVDEQGQPVSGIPIFAQMQQKAQWVIMQGAGLDYSNGSEPGWSQKWDSILGVLSARAITQTDGSFRLMGLTTAPYNLSVLTSDGSFGSKTPGDWVAPSVEGAWAKDGQVVRRSQPIIMTRGNLISGRVVDKATGRPLAGINFGSNGPQLPESVDSVIGATSDAQGRFTLRVAPGVTSLYIAGPAINDGDFVYADNKKPANVYRIQSKSNAYAGSENVEYELDGERPQFGLNFSRGLKSSRIQIPVPKGHNRQITLRLRRIVKAPLTESE
jgi:beta-lactamase regulating signal transducer with metallopeptidase domain